MTPSDLLTLRVTFADPAAASRITPAAASRYLTVHGWTATELMIWNRWAQDDREVLVPRDTSWADYGARVVELLNRLAEHEGRSVLAVYVDMLAGETGSA
jgi:hypothetical protein